MQEHSIFRVSIYTLSENERTAGGTNFLVTAGKKHTISNSKKYSQTSPSSPHTYTFPACRESAP